MAKLRYLGGASLHGVPARDLSSDEAKRFGMDRLLASGLYEKFYQRKPKKKAEAPPPEPEEVEGDIEIKDIEED